MKFRDFEGEQYATAEGMIATGLRGRGYASPIDRALMDLFQRQANRANMRIIWEISNANEEGVDSEKSLLEVGKGTPGKLEKLVEEQARWQSLWGRNGKLGLDSSQRKDFLPNRGDSRITELAAINCSGGKREIQEAAEGYIQKKSRALEMLIEQMVS